MPRRDYFLVSSLPAMGELGSTPPISPRELCGLVDDQPMVLRIVQAVLLGDDLLQRQSFLAGEIKEVEPSVLTAAQAAGQEPLPAHIEQTDTAAPRVASDAQWIGYYRYLLALSHESGVEFLAQYAAFEIALRNALATARAAALGLEAGDYLVLGHLGQTDANLEQVVNDWRAALTPLGGLRLLDEFRWRWLAAHDKWFSFSLDEFAAYAAKLTLVLRWQRLAEQKR